MKKSTDSAPGGIRQKVVGLDKKYGIFKVAKFAIASGSGFLLAEGILTLGVLRLYGKLSAPSNSYSSPAFLGVDVAALALGVAFSFFLNEHYTVDEQRTRSDAGSNNSSSLPVRLLKFEGVNAMGNVTIIAVQFALLLTLSITPVVGNIVGAIVSYPVTYLISMRFVWKPPTSGPTGKGQTSRIDRRPKKAGPPPPPIAALVVLTTLYVIGRIVRRRAR